MLSRILCQKVFTSKLQCHILKFFTKWFSSEQTCLKKFREINRFYFQITMLLWFVFTKYFLSESFETRFDTFVLRSVKTWNHCILSWVFTRRNFYSIWRRISPMKSSIMTLKWIHEKNSHSFFCLFCCNWFHEKTLSKFHFALLQSVSREKKIAFSLLESFSRKIDPS